MLKNASKAETEALNLKPHYFEVTKDDEQELEGSLRGGYAAAGSNTPFSCKPHYNASPRMHFDPPDLWGCEFMSITTFLLVITISK